MYNQTLSELIKDRQSVLCVGLDSVYEKLPACVKNEAAPQWIFNRAIIDATHDLVCSYKINYAFYAACGVKGIEAVKQSIHASHAYGIPVILDVKWGDIGHTAEYYAISAFDELEADAVTLNPYMGEDAIAPFRKYEERGSYILCFTSNSSRRDLQTKQVMNEQGDKTLPLYEVVAGKIRKWNTSGNLGAVVGATAPEQLENVRSILGPDASILCPGVGVQGGDLEEVLFAGGAENHNLVINVSRAIINASPGADFDEAARREAQMFADQSRNFFNRPIED